MFHVLSLQLITYLAGHFFMIKRFAANKYFLRSEKRNIIDFTTKNSAHSTLRVGYKEKYVEETVNKKKILV
jgi:hypothetical protein